MICEFHHIIFDDIPNFRLAYANGTNPDFDVEIDYAANVDFGDEDESSECSGSSSSDEGT